MSAPTSSIPHFKPRIRRLSKTRWLVESRSQHGLGRQVDTYRLRCSCPAGAKGTRCWHLVWALGAEEYYRRAEQEHAQRIKAAPAMTRPPCMAALQDAFAS